jgi:hypothetical protein
VWLRRPHIMCRPHIICRHQNAHGVGTRSCTGAQAREQCFHDWDKRGNDVEDTIDGQPHQRYLAGHRQRTVDVEQAQDLWVVGKFTYKQNNNNSSSTSSSSSSAQGGSAA